MPDDNCRDKRESENLTYTLEEIDNANEKVTYNQLIREVDLIEMTSEMQFDTLMAKEINYSTNFTRKDLDRIADYYSIGKRKKLKDELIQDIIIFENDPENIEITYRRKKLWSYMEEIKDDKYLRKFLIFN